MPNIRLPDPLTDPNAPGFTAVSVVNSMPKYVDELNGGRKITLESAAQQWGFTLTYSDLFKEQYEILESTILKSIQTGDKLEVLIPHLETMNVTEDPSTITIAAGQKGTNLRLTNYTLSEIPKAGDMIKLTNHSSKVYKILEVSQAGAIVDLVIFPALRKTTTGLETPIFSYILYEVSVNDPTAWNHNFTVDGIFSGFQLELTENITDL